MARKSETRTFQPKRVVGSRFGSILTKVAGVAVALCCSVATVALSQISGTITDGATQPIAGCQVCLFLPSTTTTVVPCVTTDASGEYSALAPDGTYDVQVIPPDNQFGSAIARSIASVGPTIVSFVLVAPDVIVLRGRVLDGFGTGVGNQLVELVMDGGPMFTMRTDTAGTYQFQVSPGSYYLKLAHGNNVTVPSFFDLSTIDPFQLSQSTIMDIRLPLTRVGIHVQDPAGNPVAGVRVTTSEYATDGLMLGIFPASGLCAYGGSGTATNTTGDATLWLYSTTSSGEPYDFISLAPPSATGWSTTVLKGLAILNDTTITLGLASGLTLSGRVLDGLGNGVVNQLVELIMEDGPMFMMRTNPEGTYQFQVSPGSYYLKLVHGNNVTVPSFFDLSTVDPFVLSQSTIMDIPLPLKPVAIHVQDPTGSPVAGVRVRTSEYAAEQLTLGVFPASGLCAYGSSGTVTNASGDATLWLFPTFSGVPYSFISLAPPLATGWSTTVLKGFAFLDDTTFTLELTSGLALTGRVLDGLGNGVGNQLVELVMEDGPMLTMRTDPTGTYLFRVSADRYSLKLVHGNNVTVPSFLDFSTIDPFLLSQATTMDIQLPLERVAIHVQDPTGTPVAGVRVKTSEYYTSALTLGAFPAYGVCAYGGAGAATDSQGDVTLWLFPTEPGEAYDFISFTPPTATGLAATTLHDVVISSNTFQLVNLISEASVGVEGSAGLFALRPENPVLGTLKVRFSLPSGEPAMLEAFDVSGRRVALREIKARGPGWHAAGLGGLPTGMYVVRLSQSGRSLNSRAIVLR